MKSVSTDTPNDVFSFVRREHRGDFGNQRRRVFDESEQRLEARIGAQRIAVGRDEDAGAVDLAHAAGAERREDFVGPQLRAGTERHENSTIMAGA